MANGQIKWYKSRLRKAASYDEGVKADLKKAADGIAARANALGSSFRTEKTIRRDTGEHVGGTAPVYVSSVKTGRKGNVAIASTGNYSARKDNLKNNTLLKALK